MTCPRCEGLVVREYLLDPREGSLTGFHASRCLNCGAIHDDVIRLNQRVPPSLKRREIAQTLVETRTAEVQMVSL